MQSAMLRFPNSRTEGDRQQVLRSRSLKKDEVTPYAFKNNIVFFTMLAISSYLYCATVHRVIFILCYSMPCYIYIVLQYAVLYLYCATVRRIIFILCYSMPCYIYIVLQYAVLYLYWATVCRVIFILCYSTPYYIYIVLQ